MPEDDVQRLIEAGLQGDRPLPIPTQMMQPQIKPIQNLAPGATGPPPQQDDGSGD